MIWFKCK